MKYMVHEQYGDAMPVLHGPFTKAEGNAWIDKEYPGMRLDPWASKWAWLVEIAKSSQR